MSVRSATSLQGVALDDLTCIDSHGRQRRRARPSHDYQTGRVWSYDAANGNYIVTVLAEAPTVGGMTNILIERNAGDRFIQWSHVAYSVLIPEAHLEQWLHDLDAWLVE